MALPIMTPEQRADALAKGALVRGERADIKERLKKGTLTLAELIDQADKSDVIGKLKVAAVLKSLPGIGDATARQVMVQLGIDEGRRLRGLGAKQRAALVHKFEPIPA